jgi:hypothetical protein
MPSEIETPIPDELRELALAYVIQLHKRDSLTYPTQGMLNQMTIRYGNVATSLAIEEMTEVAVLTGTIDQSMKIDWLTGIAIRNHNYAIKIKDTIT